jgi:hypothetical protein
MRLTMGFGGLVNLHQNSKLQMEHLLYSVDIEHSRCSMLMEQHE